MSVFPTTPKQSEEWLIPLLPFFSRHAKLPLRLMKGIIECLVPSISSVSRLGLIHEVEAIWRGRRADFECNEGREVVQSRCILELVFCAPRTQMMWAQLYSK